jgi:hypothetical protein
VNNSTMLARASLLRAPGSNRKYPGSMTVKW